MAMTKEEFHKFVKDLVSNEADEDIVEIQKEGAEIIESLTAYDKVLADKMKIFLTTMEDLHTYASSRYEVAPAGTVRVKEG